MTESRQHQRPGSDWPPPPETPADQPNPPSDECTPLPTSAPPKLEQPEPCAPPKRCKCPGSTPPDKNCLEKMIDDKAAAIAAAEKTKAFKTDLEALLGKVKTATQEYTRERFDKLVKQWVEQDEEIAKLTRTVECAVKCWDCVIECHVCPLLEKMRIAAELLNGDGTLCSEVHTLYDVLHWRTRDRDAKERRFKQIKDVLLAWEKPAQSIEKVLADNAKLIADAKKSEPGKIIFDLFMRIVPMHLAIAPPKGSNWTTRIDKRFTEVCKCDEGKPDHCCGPDVGELALRQQVLRPQPYLIDPDQYSPMICCLVEKRYGPAQEAFVLADTAVTTAENEIKRNKALIENGLKSFEKDAKAAIPSDIDCCNYKESGTEPEQSQDR